MLRLLLAVPCLIAVPNAAPSSASEVHALLDQPLAPFVDTCDTHGDTKVRHVRSATLDSRGATEDRIELRTTTRGADSSLDYIVNDVVLFTDRQGEPPLVTDAGRAFLADDSRSAKVLAAIAVMHPRIFEADVSAPQHACGTLHGKPEEQAKCALIGVIGCLPPTGGVTCGISALLAVGCNWLVEKACENEPETCEPGWTEG